MDICWLAWTIDVSHLHDHTDYHQPVSFCSPVNANSICIIYLHSDKKELQQEALHLSADLTPHEWVKSLDRRSIIFNRQQIFMLKTV